MGRLERALIVAGLAAFAATGACVDLFHSTEWSACADCKGGTGQIGGSSSGGSSSSGDAGAGGDGGSNGACLPGETRACYSGPERTQGVGTCMDGTQSCQAAGTWGACEGEVPPATEDCITSEDEDCGGDGNAGCPLPTCADVKTLDPGAVDGTYTIDPDGAAAGTLDPIEVFCDMTTEGGGWTLLAKTVKAGLTAQEMATVREGFWVDYTQTGYGSPLPGSRIYWMPLRYWHAVTLAKPANELVSRTGTTDVRVTSFAVGDETQKYAWSWAGPSQGSPEIAAGLNGMGFTARDMDNDVWPSNCSVDNVGLNGGFWYESCYQLSMLHNNGNVYRLDTNITVSVEYNEIWLR